MILHAQNCTCMKIRILGNNLRGTLSWLLVLRHYILVLILFDLFVNCSSRVSNYSFEFYSNVVLGITSSTLLIFSWKFFRLWIRQKNSTCPEQVVIIKYSWRCPGNNIKCASTTKVAQVILVHCFSLHVHVVVFNSADFSWISLPMSFLKIKILTTWKWYCIYIFISY